MSLARYVTLLVVLIGIADASVAADIQRDVTASVDWDTVTNVSKSSATMLVLGATPVLRRESPIRDSVYSAVAELGARYVRYMPYGAYPRLAIPELEPPTKTATSWDFSLIDPEMIRFLEITKDREPVIDFSEIPDWMVKTSKPVPYPSDPNKLAWNYMWDKAEANDPKHPNLKTVLLADPTGKQIADYYARVFSWYTNGGFTDENGQFHRSGYHYKIPWWEVFNEMDGLGITPQQYVMLYDRIVTAIRKISPTTKFIGLSLSSTASPKDFDPQFVEYFLDPKNHQPGVPIDMISYHYYSISRGAQTLDNLQYTFFDQANGFLGVVELVDLIRKRLSPSTLVNWDEVGTILGQDLTAALSDSDQTATDIPAGYWNLSGALYAYLYLEAAKRGIDVVGESESTGYPGYFPSTSLVNWATGKVNARFRVLELLNKSFGPGDKLVYTEDSDAYTTQDVAVQGIITPAGKRLLLINKRSWPVAVDLQGNHRVNSLTTVDEISGEGPARSQRLDSNKVVLGPFAVAVASIEK